MNAPKIIPPLIPRSFRAKFYPMSAAKSQAKFVAAVFADIDKASLEQLALSCRGYWQSDIAREDAAARRNAEYICAEAHMMKTATRRHADIYAEACRNKMAARAATDELQAMRWHPTREWLPPEDAWFFLIRFVGKGEKGAARNSLVCCFIDNLFRRERARAFLERVEQRLSAANYKK